MKSEDLRNIKKVSKEKRKKVLLVNCARPTYMTGLMPHVGLGVLSGILTKRGHEVLVVDYLLSEDAPSIAHFINNFKPDIIGFSAYSWSMEKVKEKISEARKVLDKIPIIIGGPHASMIPQDLLNDKRIDYIVLREGELVIIDLVENGKRQKAPKIIEAKEFVNLNDVPLPNYKTFYKWESVTSYPIYTSKGCPYNCSYCSADVLGKRIWRKKSPEKCIQELKEAKKIFKKDFRVFVIDDEPMIDKKNFIEFLKLYLKSKLGMRLDVYNVRADNVTEELLILLKKCGSTSFSIAVEHVDKEVMDLVNKRESLEDIEKAIRLVKKHGFRLILFFIIGLPADSYEKTKKSIKFAQKFNPHEVVWNIYRYTGPNRAMEWFEKNGTVDKLLYTKSILKKRNFYPDAYPATEYPGFKKNEIIKAYYMAMMRTYPVNMRLRDAFEVFRIAKKYNLYWDFFYWLPRGFLRALSEQAHLFKVGARNLRKEGFINTGKKLIYLTHVGRL